MISSIRIRYHSLILPYFAVDDSFVSSSPILDKSSLCAITNCFVIDFYSDLSGTSIEDANGQFWRIQCKKGRWKEDEGVVEFTVRRSGSYRQGKWSPQSYKNDAIDYFAVYCRELDKVYLVPSDLVGVNTAWLRVLDSKSKRGGGRHLAAKWAADYEL